MHQSFLDEKSQRIASGKHLARQVWQTHGVTKHKVAQLVLTLRVLQLTDGSTGNRGGRDYDSGPSGLSNPRQTTVYQGNETCRHPTTAIEPRQRTSESPIAARQYPTLCQQCAELHQLVRQIAHELSTLLAEIRGAMTGEHLKHYTILVITFSFNDMRAHLIDSMTH